MDLTYAEFLGCLSLPDDVLADAAKIGLISNANWGYDELWHEDTPDYAIAYGVRTVLLKLFDKKYGALLGNDASSDTISIPPIFITT